jgi:hypothetical protein
LLSSCEVPGDDKECVFVEIGGKCFTGNCSDYNGNDYIDYCDELDVCMVKSGLCVINPCGSFIADEDGGCNYPCILDISNESLCLIDPCIDYDEVSCIDNYLSFCSVNRLENSCRIYRCPDVDLRW